MNHKSKFTGILDKNGVRINIQSNITHFRKTAEHKLPKK